MLAPYERFMDLVGRILSANGFTIQALPPGRDRGFDFIGLSGGENWAIETKFYRTAIGQPSLILAAARRLNEAALKAQFSKGILAVSCRIPAGFRMGLERNFKLAFLDRDDLVRFAAPDPVLLGELQALIDGEPDNADQTEKAKEKPKAKPKLPDKPLVKAKAPTDTQGSDLCKELRKLPRGNAHWSAYEDLCFRILQYLFNGHLQGWHKQKRTDDGLNRFDLVCRVPIKPEFWGFLAQHLDSRYVIFEFKNYDDKIKQGQILTTEKYLLEKALRRVAIIFTRMGANDDAVKMMQGAMREHGKLMLVLDDDSVCHMLHMKEHGDDPTDYLLDITDNFLMTLPR